MSNELRTINRPDFMRAFGLAPLGRGIDLTCSAWWLACAWRDPLRLRFRGEACGLPQAVPSGWLHCSAFHSWTHTAESTASSREPVQRGAAGAFDIAAELVPSDTSCGRCSIR